MDDREYIPLSYLSQADYCLRRAALLLNERAWQESADTAKGREEHSNVHTQRVERRGDFIKIYEYTVFSEAMRIVGKCDCIEATRSEDGCIMPLASFPIALYPVEYKHGIVRDEQEYNIQLCAQAICLEEMFDTKIDKGAIFYISSHRRQEVILTEELREKTRLTAASLWKLRESLSIPSATYGAKCNRCSIKEYCMPQVKTSAKAYCCRIESEATEV